MSDGYQVREFRAADYVAVHEAMVTAGGPGLSREALAVGEAYERFSLARTATHDGVVLGCAGLLSKWEGLAEAWLVLTPEARKDHGLVIARMVKRHMLQFMQQFRRIEADVLEGWGDGLDFAGWLGFRLESVMPSYGPKGEAFVKCTIINSTRAREG